MPATEYAPEDNLIGPIIASLTQIIQEQIPSIQTIYPTPTDGTPDDGSVQFPYEITLDDVQYPGVMRLDINLYITQVFKRNRLDAVYARMQPYIFPWLMLLGAWRNQYLVPDPELMGFATQILQLDKKVRMIPMMLNGQPYIALVFKVCIIVEFQVDTNES